MSQPSQITHVSAYASVMVSLDLGPDAENRVRLAAGLADRFSSQLIGIAAHEILPPLYFAHPVDGVASPLELEQHRAAQCLSNVEALFRRSATNTNALEWRSAIKPSQEFLLEQARAADIIVIGRRGTTETHLAPMRVDAGAVVMDAGRPVLLVPPQTDRLSARRVVVGWKDTREARRAVWDSLPMLRQAEEVFVVAIDTQNGGVKDVGTYLSRHGVASNTFVCASATKSAADELARIAQQEGADLIVCGAYGHSRTSEWVFGGVTRDLLDHAPVCCLLTH